jgi:hypothetical protein
VRNEYEHYSHWDIQSDGGNGAGGCHFVGTETAYAAAADPKELVIIPGANYVDLYDQVNVIPFGKLTSFFTEHLNQDGRGDESSQ